MRKKLWELPMLGVLELNLAMLITGFVSCCTDIVALYTDGADDGASLRVETLPDCGVPRSRGDRGCPRFCNINTKKRLNSTTKSRDREGGPSSHDVAPIFVPRYTDSSAQHAQLIAYVAR
ncbi:hypothetical protein SVAN01_11733 [Stagonosporopsis vannaccii]|nr:hypothetical protein SVAN01_11733 [Stagonosporopsis vannaccii]